FMAVNRRRVGLTIVFIIILTISAALFDGHVSPLEEGGRSLDVPNWVPGASFWNKFDFHLGLDLKGGTHLLYQADTSKIDNQDADSAVEGVRDVIERRVNAFGVAEPVVQVNKSQAGDYRIIVELAGIKDVNQAINMIGETPLLEFKEQNPSFTNQQINLTPEQQKELDTYNEAASKKAEEINKRALAGEDFAKLSKEFSEDPGSKDNGGDLDWATKGTFVEEFEKAIFDDLKSGQITPAPVKSQFGYHIIKKMDERQAQEVGATATVNGTTTPVEINNTEVLSAHILIKTKTAADIVPPVDQWLNTQLSGKHLKRASVQYTQNTGEPEVSLEFNDEGGKLFEEITERNVGKPVAIFLDGNPISVPTVNEKITGGKAVITGRFNLKESKDLVEKLNAGALPVPIELISQKTVGPSLGKKSVEQSLLAGLWGLLAVAAFMLLYYRLPGLISVLALTIYTLIVLALFKLLNVTLTLSGIAGFIMSIGMAVDANVLIFERLKEELRNGRSYGSALEEGFKRAWPSIRDSNVSTFITCAILLWVGTSVMKGFAVTLAIGIVVSMFSAIAVSRSFMRALPARVMDNVKWLVWRGKKIGKTV
ncbi:MAG: hypothetical protein UV02_C0009G0009, partial [Candidatus Kuenenbacteria bacterium GW2011_GWA2_42_15]